MIDFNIEYLFPRYFLNDRNGYALAKAFEAALMYMLDRINIGYDTVFDISKMPEWRLDEVAWEQNQLYNYAATEQVKRELLIEMENAYAIYGTKAAVKQFIRGDEKNADVQEWFEYGGQPYHYKIVLDGRWVNEKMVWNKYVLDRVKNVRSVLDKVEYHDELSSAAYMGLAISSTESVTMQMQPASIDGLNWLTDENGTLLLDEKSSVLYD